MSYPLITRRLVIEPLVEADVAEFLAYRRDPEVARWQSWTPDYTAADARRLIAGQPTTVLPGPGSWLQLAIRARDGSPLHGDVAIHRLDGQPDTFEIGVTLAPQSQGLGLATEAVATVLEHRVISWMCELAGFSKGSGGTLTGGGTEATFTALLGPLLVAVIV